ncbi:MAG: hypothetical protein Q4B12_08625 [Bowdeniella nasicola]|nr:hypothetical protein [Bowdeniella nasicola]
MTGIPTGDYRPDGAFAAPFVIPHSAAAVPQTGSFATPQPGFTVSQQTDFSAPSQPDFRAGQQPTFSAPAIPENSPSTFVFPGTESVNPAEVFSTPGYNAPRISQSPLALVSLILACLFFIPIVPLVGAALGGYTLKTSNFTYQLGRSRCISAIVLGAAFSLLQLLWFILASEAFSL